MPLFEIKQVDRDYFRFVLDGFIPKRIFDIHAHVWVDSFIQRKHMYHRGVDWPLRVAKDNSIEDLQQTYELLFPGHEVTPLIFGFPDVDTDVHISNDYIMNIAKKFQVPSLLLSHPGMDAEELERNIRTGGFRGIKPYFCFAPHYIPENEIRISDYLPDHHLEVLNRNRWTVILHIPRPGRLRDSVNLAQLMDIEQHYPDVNLVVAHVGRAYCPEDLGNAFDILGKSEKMVFDISANTSVETIYAALESVGPERVLFGSDLPITRMRMQRICENGNYVNLVPAGLYGDISQDPHMRDVFSSQADRFTLFLYEQIAACKNAVERLGMNKYDIDNIFWGNAVKILGLEE